MKIPRILLTAGASGSGKTLITCGILQALVQRNKKVASFKCGPDFIDPMFHTQVIGTKSRNLDTFFTGEALTNELLRRNAEDCDIAVMEGVMGFYDGVGGTTVKASAYDLARVTKTPAILIVNSKGMSVSIAAYIKGFLEYMPDSNLRGVIFNQMSPMLYPRVKALVEEQLPIRVLGYVPKVEDCVIESRHLGLVLPDEIPELKDRLQKLSEILEKSLDLDAILALAEEAPEMEDSMDFEQISPLYTARLDQPVRIGIAKDEAFCFIYEDNLRLLQNMGATLVPFSPIHDAALPDNLDGLIFYGGYPELFGKELSENSSMIASIRSSIQKGIPYLAECGGFMYLHEQMEDMNHQMHSMAGIIHGVVHRTPRLTRFGYITLSQKESTPEVFGEKDLGKIPAHEFHYYDSTECGNSFVAKKPESTRSWECIHGDHQRLVGYPHLYYYGNPSVPWAFLKTCLEYQKKRCDL